MLIGECGKYQERIAELEADLEEAERVREQHLGTVILTVNCNCLWQFNWKYQERIAELEADLEEAERVREQHLGTVILTVKCNVWDNLTETWLS